MLKVEFLKLELGGVVLRYYLMMMIVIVAGFTGQVWLALFALPIFLSAILAVSFKIKKAKPARAVQRIPVRKAQAA